MNGDQDYLVIGLIISTLKLFYGLSDEFFGLFLDDEKLEEIDKLIDDRQSQKLHCLFNTYNQLKNINSEVKFMMGLPLLDELMKVLMIQITLNLIILVDLAEKTC